MLASVDKGIDPKDIAALYLGNFSNDFFVRQAHWGPLTSDVIGLVPRAATRTEGACASSSQALREGVWFLVYEAPEGGEPVEVDRLDELSMHEVHADSPAS